MGGVPHGLSGVPAAAPVSVPHGFARRPLRHGILIPAGLYLSHRGIHLTQVTTRSSVFRDGRLPHHPAGFGATLLHGSRMPGVPATPSMARGCTVPSLPRAPRLGDRKRALGLSLMWSSGLRDSGDDLPGHSPPFEPLVSSRVVGVQPEEWGQRPGSAKSPWAGQLPDGVDLAPQVPAGDGSSWSGSADGSGRGGRDVLGGPIGGDAWTPCGA